MRDIFMTEMDFVRLSSIMEVSRRDEASELEQEIDRAQVVDFPEIPSDLVTMNSRLRYLDMTENKEGEIAIVYPQFADVKEHKISVLAPLGAALIGLRVGEEIEWTFPDGKIRKLKVLELLYQPESNGDLSY